MESIYFVVCAVWVVIWGIVVQNVNKNKGYEGGFWLGFFLGVFGLIIVLSKPNLKVTPIVIQRMENDETDADKLIAFKKLLDDGVLTQAEYDAKKAEILSRM